MSTHHEHHLDAAPRTRRFRWHCCGFLLACSLSGSVLAAAVPAGATFTQQTVNGNTVITWSPPGSPAVAGGHLLPGAPVPSTFPSSTYGGYGVGSATAGEVPISAQVKVPLANPAAAIGPVYGTAGPAALGGAAAAAVTLYGKVNKFLMVNPALVWGLNICLLACPAIKDWVTSSGISVDNQGGLQKDLPPDAKLSPYKFDWLGQWINAEQRAAKITDYYGNPCLVDSVVAGHLSIKCAKESGGFSYYSADGVSACASGEFYGSTGGCFPLGSPAKAPVSVDEAAQKLAQTPISDTKLTDVAKELDKGQRLPAPDSVTASGPSTVDGGKVTKTNPDGSSTVTQTTYNVTHNNNQTTINQTTTTNTYNSSGSLTSTETVTGPAATPEEQRDLCRDYPNASACAELGQASNEDAQKWTRTLGYTEKNISLPATCPAPLSGTAYGYSYQITYAGPCQFAQGIRPVVILCASLIAALIVTAGVRAS